MLGCCADGFAGFEQCISLEPIIWPMHRAPAVHFAALHLSLAKDETNVSLTCVLLSYMYTLISSARMYRAELVGLGYIEVDLC